MLEGKKTTDTMLRQEFKWGKIKWDKIKVFRQHRELLIGTCKNEKAVCKWGRLTGWNVSDWRVCMSNTWLFILLVVMMGAMHARRRGLRSEKK